jgi:hypothetical protein
METFSVSSELTGRRGAALRAQQCTALQKECARNLANIVTNAKYQKVANHPKPTRRITNPLQNIVWFAP